MSRISTLLWLQESGNVSIAVAVIGLLGGILAALIAAFAEDIRGLFSGRSKELKRFVGHWRCTWEADVGVRAGQKLVDNVHVTKVAGAEIVATGANQHGGYDLTGSILHNNLIIFTYGGERLEKALAGVVILYASTKRDRMEGRWDQYAEDEKFVGGTTTWEKVAG